MSGLSSVEGQHHLQHADDVTGGRYGHAEGAQIDAGPLAMADAGVLFPLLSFISMPALMISGIVVEYFVNLQKGNALRLAFLSFSLAALMVIWAARVAVQAQPAEALFCSQMTKGTLKLRASWTIPLLKSVSGSKAVLLQSTKDPSGKDDEMNVNSDGSPRAYHLLDPEGRKYALNDMYSGGVRVWENDVEIPKPDAHYYEVFRKFVADNGNFGVEESKYDPRADRTYRVGSDFGNHLDPSAATLNANIPPSHATNADFGIVVEAPTAIPAAPSPAIAAPRPFEPADYTCLSCKIAAECRVCFPKAIIGSAGGQLCPRKAGRYVGFLVNKTGLDEKASNAADPENSEDRTCGAASNLDSEKLPGLVLPAGSIAVGDDPALKVSKGDVVVGYNPVTRMWAFAIVSDGGPRGKLGEASIAFNRILSLGYEKGATTPRPISYHGGLLNHIYQPKRPIALLLLPGSIERFKSPRRSGLYDFSPKKVAATAKAAFLEWAGTSDMDAARLRYLQCLSLLPPD